MATNTPDNNLQDDQVLAKLYKERAKDTPPAKLNSEILNYAANAKKSTSDNNSVGSHFGGGWKVPLSMAASVVVVFALLVQLDQSPRNIELPPIPGISVPAETKQQNSNDEALSSTATREEAQESEDALLDGEASDLLIEQDEQSSAIQSKPKAAKKNVINKPEQKLEQELSRERVYQAPLEKAEPAIIPSESPSASSDTSNSSEGYAPKLDKAESINKSIERQTQKPAGAINRSSTVTSGDMMEEEAMRPNSVPSREDAPGASDSTADSDVELETNAGSEFAPLPVEDWLLVIETLVAQKDYAEAARQLQKFKQAHPKVNVEDLESKIP